MSIDQIEATTPVFTVGTVAIDGSGPRTFFLTPVATNLTINVGQAPAGTIIEVAFQQDGVGGRTVTFNNNGAAPVFPGAGTGAPATGINQYTFYTLFWPRPDLCLITKVIA